MPIGGMREAAPVTFTFQVLIAGQRSRAQPFQRFKIWNKIGFQRVPCPKFGRDDAPIDQETAW
jgi:hypothetical protein